MTLKPIYIERQRDDDSDIGLIESNGVAPEWGNKPFLSSSFVSLRSVTSVIAALTLTLSVTGPLDAPFYPAEIPIFFY